MQSAIRIYPVSTTIALRAGTIDGESQARGFRIPLADLLIGVTAVELGFKVGTANVRDFQRIPNLSVLKLG